MLFSARKSRQQIGLKATTCSDSCITSKFSLSFLLAVFRLLLGQEGVWVRGAVEGVYLKGLLAQSRLFCREMDCPVRALLGNQPAPYSGLPGPPGPKCRKKSRKMSPGASSPQEPQKSPKSPGTLQKHSPDTFRRLAATFPEEILEKKSRTTPETLSEPFLEFPSRVRLGSPKPYTSRHLKPPEHFQNCLPLSTAGDASFLEVVLERASQSCPCLAAQNSHRKIAVTTVAASGSQPFRCRNRRVFRFTGRKKIASLATFWDISLKIAGKSQRPRPQSRRSRAISRPQRPRDTKCPWNSQQH